MQKSEKIETLRRWLESGASDFDYEKSKLLLEKIYSLPDAQIDSIFRLYEESVQQRSGDQEQDIQKNSFFHFFKIIPSSIKTIFIIAIIASSIVMLYSHNKAVAKRITVTRNGSIITIESDKNIVEFEKIEDIDDEYRVFGISLKDNLFDYIYVSMVIHPLDNARISWSRNICEVELQKTFIFMIVPDKVLREKINSFNEINKTERANEHFSLRLKGEALKIKDDSIFLSGDMNHEFWLLSEAEEVVF